MPLLELTIVGIFLVIAVTVLVGTARTGVPPMPTSPGAKRVMLTLLPPETEGPVVELGLGWGTIAFALAKRYPNARVIAYEVSWLPWLFCLLRRWVQPRPNLELRWGDFRRSSLEQALVVTCYLAPWTMTALKPRFETELAPGAVVVSNTFAVPGWTPQAWRRVPDLVGTRVYRYRVPDARGAVA